MTMIERVARAMENHCYSVMEQRGDGAPDVYRRLGRPEWEELARAAIEAMRGPTTEVLIEASSVSVSDHIRTYQSCGPLVLAILDKVVDAALAEEG